jgi:hypothetical protein
MQARRNFVSVGIFRRAFDPKFSMSASARATLHELIQQQTSPYFSAANVRQALRQRGVRIADPSLRVYLSEAVKKGLVQDAGHGWYSRLVARVPLDLQPVRKLIRAVEKEFPLLDFSCWSTAQINPWTHHVLAQPTAFLYAAGDALPAVAEFLRRKGWDAIVNPLPSQGAEQVKPGPRSVVLRPAISKQPQGEHHQAPIEKILVDLLMETPRVALMDDREAGELVRSLMQRYLVQVSTLQSYGERRGLQTADLLPINKVHFRS